MNDDSRSIDEFETGIKLACLEGDDRATTLAADLAIPTVANLSEAELCLYYQPQGLSLYSRSINSSICIDYNSGKAGHRRRFGGGKQQLISKACGLHKRSGLKIIDATAGLGYDAFVLASLGANVTMLERNTILQQLLIDALSRLPDDSIKIILQAGDANQCLASLCIQHNIDVIYLDPMFPTRKKSAQVKKEAQILQQLVGKPEDHEQLLTTALKCQAKRVVVKRPPFGSKLK